MNEEQRLVQKRSPARQTTGGTRAPSVTASPGKARNRTILDQPAIAVNAMKAQVDPGLRAEVVEVRHHSGDDEQREDLDEGV